VTPPIGVADLGSTYVSGSFYVCAGNGVDPDWRETVNSPTVKAGSGLGSDYQWDMWGFPRGAQWDMGATQMPAFARGTPKHF
jgi:hypothetical protein